MNFCEMQIGAKAFILITFIDSYHLMLISHINPFQIIIELQNKSNICY